MLTEVKKLNEYLITLITRVISGSAVVLIALLLVSVSIRAAEVSGSDAQNVIEETPIFENRPNPPSDFPAADAIVNVIDLYFIDTYEDSEKIKVMTIEDKEAISVFMGDISDKTMQELHDDDAVYLTNLLELLSKYTKAALNNTSLTKGELSFHSNLLKITLNSKEGYLMEANYTESTHSVCISVLSNCTISSEFNIDSNAIDITESTVVDSTDGLSEAALTQVGTYVTALNNMSDEEAINSLTLKQLGAFLSGFPNSTIADSTKLYLKGIRCDSFNSPWKCYLFTSRDFELRIPHTVVDSTAVLSAAILTTATVVDSTDGLSEATNHKEKDIIKEKEDFQVKHSVDRLSKFITYQANEKMNKNGTKTKLGYIEITNNTPDAFYVLIDSANLGVLKPDAYTDGEKDIHYTVEFDYSGKKSLNIEHITSVSSAQLNAGSIKILKLKENQLVSEEITKIQFDVIVQVETGSSKLMGMAGTYNDTLTFTYVDE